MFQRRKNISVQQRDCSYDIVVKNAVVLCPCPKKICVNLHWRFLAREISIQPSFDWDMWLWVASLVQINNEKVQARQRKSAKCVVCEERGTRKCNGAKFWVECKEINRLKKSLVLSGRKGVVTSQPTPHSEVYNLWKEIKESLGLPRWHTYFFNYSEWRTSIVSTWFMCSNNSYLFC